MKNNIKHITTANFPTKYGNFKLFLYSEIKSKKEHLALVCGNVLQTDKPILARIHSACLTGDALFSARCDCGEQLEASMKMIKQNKSGVLLYLDQEGRGIGLKNKIKCYTLQDKGLDTVEANEELGFLPDERSFEVAGQILKDLEIDNIVLLTNNPDKIQDLENFGIKVKRKKIWLKDNKHNHSYISTKIKKLRHLKK